MCEKKSRSEEYSSTREAFDSLNAEEKLTFLAESAAKAFVDGVQEVVSSFSEAMENGWPAEDDSEQETDDATKEAAEKKKTASKKPAAKRKTTKKASPKKTPKKASDSTE
ncbi:MAG: hypothetical protein HOC28_00230 [Bacteroidetes Order II. Incertae sedis bacterium]|jgi:hypothetical protein|nr:hypothetical protein [Bacteroidetes Order II. bacterium]MDG1755126.1 hypothetical protein [Rhodothermales bacterium]HAY35856.1 hypothetical protein [Bacteroidota bacterium]MBT4051677.1 hypothetical protein [Bacteroidetes Order II. bacterium]MBT4601536.1 hypothetical protein [Bacteroidetes Order II. bacterium]